MKYCKYCNKSYNENNFGIALTTPTKVYRRNKCRLCYQKTKVKHKHSKADWLIEYKKTLKCDICSFSDYRALCFHHVDEKIESVSKMISNYSIKKVKEEIKKCKVLCANCHMILHEEDRRSQRAIA